MKTGWKIFLIILVILIIIGVIWGYKQYNKWMGIWNQIHFSKPIPTSLDLNGITLQDLVGAQLSGTPLNVKAGIKMIVTNDSDTAVSFSKLKIQILYNGSLITETTDALYNKDFTLPAKSNGVSGVLPIEDNITIQLNNAKDFLIQKVTGKHPSLGYKVDVNVEGIPISRIYPIEGTFDW